MSDIESTICEFRSREMFLRGYQDIYVHIYTYMHKNDAFKAMIGMNEKSEGIYRRWHIFCAPRTENTACEIPPLLDGVIGILFGL